MPETNPNVPNVIVRPALVAPTVVKVFTEGDIVCLQIGNSIMKMPYENALQISQWLRVRGKEAKRFAGDTSRHWSLLATLDPDKA